jgi:hypothetical protein
VLIQDGGSACIMRAIGGQYKCWRGYTAASIAPDGSYALVLGAAKQEPAKKPAGKKEPGKKEPAKKAPPKQELPKPAPAPAEPEDPEHASAASVPVDDVAVPPPAGPLSLYRAKLDGPYTEAPVLLVKLVDGAAVWVPRK